MTFCPCQIQNDAWKKKWKVYYTCNIGIGQSSWTTITPNLIGLFTGRISALLDENPFTPSLNSILGFVWPKKIILQRYYLFIYNYYRNCRNYPLLYLLGCHVFVAHFCRVLCTYYTPFSLYAPNFAFQISISTLVILQLHEYVKIRRHTLIN